MSYRDFAEPNPFAKLFETPHGQLLVYLDETDDEEPAIVVMGAEVSGVRPTAKLSGWADGDAGQERAFADMDQAMAEEQAASFHNMLAGLLAEDTPQ